MPLKDDEWRCSGSKLTSQGAVCGNIARALRKSTKETLRNSCEYLTEKTMSNSYIIIILPMGEV